MDNKVEDASLERRRDYLKMCILLKEARANYAIYKDRKTLEELKEKEKEAKKFYLKLPSNVSCENLFSLIDSDISSQHPQSAY